MRIVLLGPPGSGKAELSGRMSEHFGMPVITVHSVMQRAAAEPSELGRLAKEAMEQSRVSDELLLALLRIQVPQMDLSRGFVLVDFPKNAGQADVLDSMLSDLGAGIEMVLNLEVDPDELMERLVGRITCDSCGAQYNLYVNPPMVDGVCDACGARVVRRPDDYEETISNRLRVYEAQMGPLLQYYQLNEKLHRVQADRGVDQAWTTVRKLVETLPPSVPPERPASVLADEQPAQPRREPSKKGAAKARPAKAAKTAKAGSARPVKSEKAPAVNKAAPKSAPSRKKAATQAATKAAAPKKKAERPTVSKAAPKKKPVAKKAAAKEAAKVAKKVGKKRPGAKKAAAKTSVRQTAAKKKVVAKAAKKAVAKKAPGKKTPAKKTPAKKTPAKKTPAKKTVAKKKVAVKKAAATKKVAKKATAAKRPATKKTAVKKSVAKKTAAKKKVAAKTTKKARRR